MHLRCGFFLIITLTPLPAMAQDHAALCNMLYRRLGNAPQIVGNTAEVRAYAKAVSEQNSEIRELRVEMRRRECGSISITMLGSPNDEACRSLRRTRTAMEKNRNDILQQRNQARSLVLSAHETELIKADIRANACPPPNSMPTLTPQSASVGPQDLNPLAKPQSGPDIEESSIIRFGSPPPQKKPQQAAQLPPVPERDYDPTKPVRIVGPRFFPNATDIDLANPR